MDKGPRDDDFAAGSSEAEGPHPMRIHWAENGPWSCVSDREEAGTNALRVRGFRRLPYHQV
jgi:hypothetical protein